MILRIRQSLIGAWYSAIGDDSGDRAEEFLLALNGKAWGGNKWTDMGNRFEQLVTDVLAGKSPAYGAFHKSMVVAVANEIYRAALQVHLQKKVTVDGITFLLDGTLDALRAGEIFDIKYSEAYSRRWPIRLNYYFDSPQTPMYLTLEPNAKRFTYLITDGHDLYREWYHRDEVEPIESKIRGFVGYLEAAGLMDTYIKNWRADRQ